MFITFTQVSAINIDPIEVDPETQELLAEMGFDKIPNLQQTTATPFARVRV